jgi:hypothetical protein
VDVEQAFEEKTLKMGLHDSDGMLDFHWSMHILMRKM